MTNEEAIANIKMISVAFVEPITKEQGKLIDDTFDLAIKALERADMLESLINDFQDYQKEWLTEHNDIEFDTPEEDLILAFLDDTAECYIREHTS